MSNDVKFYLRGMMNSVVQLFIAGGIIQTFFAEIGFSAQQIGSYTALNGIVQVVTMILSIFIADSTRNVKGTMALLNLSSVFFCGVMLLPCLVDDMNVEFVFWMAMALCTLHILVSGFNGILFFRFMYILAKPEEFSRLESNNTIFCGAVSIAASGLISFFAARFNFRSVMAVGFVISIIFSVGSSLALNSVRQRNDFAPVPAQPFRPSVLGRRDFYSFYLPNLLRGFACGLIGMMTVVFLQEITTDTAVVSGLSVISSVGSILGAWIFRNLKRKLDTATLYAGGSLLMCIFLPLMLLGHNTAVFYALYFVVYCAYISNNTAAALYPSEYVPYEDIGAYTSVRLIIMTLGQSIASYSIPFLLETLPAWLLLMLGGAAQLASGLMFLRYDRKYIKKQRQFL